MAKSILKNKRLPQEPKIALNKGKDIPCFWLRCFNMIKMSVLLRI